MAFRDWINELWVLRNWERDKKEDNTRERNLREMKFSRRTVTAGEAPVETL